MHAKAPEGVRLKYFGVVVYHNGQVYLPEQAEAVPGAEPEHNQINSNIVRLLGNALMSRSCCAFTSDQCVHLEGRHVYPDVVVIRASPDYSRWIGRAR